MFDFLKNSLFLKLVGLAFIAQIIAGTTLFISTQNIVTNFFAQQVQNEIDPIKSLVNSALAPLLFTEDTGAALQQVEEMHKSLNKLNYIILKNLDDRTITISGNLSSINNQHNNLNTFNEQIINDVYHSSFPITLSDEKVGYVYIGIDMSLHKVLSDNLTTSLITSMIIGAILFALLIGGFIFVTTQRLQVLVEKTKEISKGNVNETLLDETPDEIGQLTKSFNIMQKNLKTLIDGLNKEILDRKEAEANMLNQSKNAAMGEMLANIAHQWRQPLSAISIAATTIQFQFENNNLDKKSVDKFSDLIMSQAEYLSKTIDTFRNFLKGNKKVTKLSIEQEIDTAIKITEGSLRNNAITLDINLIQKDLSIMATEGELTQVIINVINNAKDILLEKSIETPIIQIELTQEDNLAIITIEDNGGGVPDNILHRVFEPYFTTKHQSKGTGLGLYMCFKIITESVHGDIFVENTDKGAKFIIQLPLAK